MALGWRGSYLRYKEFFLNISSLYKKRNDLRAFLEIILSISTVVIFIVFALKPTILTVLGLTKEIQEKRATVAALSQKVTNLQSANKLFGQNQNSISVVDSAISSIPNPDVFSKQVAGLASKNSVSVLGLSIGEVMFVGTQTPKKATQDFRELPAGANEMSFSISVRGNYANLLSFIKDFENLRLISQMDTLGVSSSKTDAGQIVVAIISGKVPFIK